MRSAAATANSSSHACALACGCTRACGCACACACGSASAREQHGGAGGGGAEGAEPRAESLYVRVAVGLRLALEVERAARGDEREALARVRLRMGDLGPHLGVLADQHVGDFGEKEQLVLPRAPRHHAALPVHTHRLPRAEKAQDREKKDRERTRRRAGG